MICLVFILVSCFAHLAVKDFFAAVGAQMVAGENIVGRINWLTSAIIAGMTADEFLVSAENAYCPPVSMVKDVVLSAAEDLVKNLNG